MDGSHNQRHSTSNLLNSICPSDNILTRRLYKNHSQSRLDRLWESREISAFLPENDRSYGRHNDSLLQNSFFKKTQESVLVPKIAVRHREMEEIHSGNIHMEKGKFILSSSKEVSLMNQSNRRHLFSKLESLSIKPSMPILPPEVTLQRSPSIDQENVPRQQPSKNLRQKLKKHKTTAISHSQKISSHDGHGCNQNQQENTLTPYDFIKILEEDPTISNEFCYLKKISNPYDLRIVDFAAREEPHSAGASRHQESVLNRRSVLPPTTAPECITISASGITYFRRDESVFVSLKEWQREADLYGKVCKLSFFKDYRIWKNFYAWKKYIRRTAMKKVSERLQSELFVTDRLLRPCILQSRQLALTMENGIKFYQIEEIERQLPTAEQLRQQQQEFRCSSFEQQLNQIEASIKKTVVDACQSSLQYFKEEIQKDMSLRNNGDSIHGKVSSENDVGDFPYTHEATVKGHYRKLTRYIRLLDYMVISGKVGLIMESTSHLRMRIEEKNSDYDKQVIKTGQKYSYKGKQWFICRLQVSDDRILSYQPDKSRLKAIFDEIIRKGVNRVCKRHKNLSQCPQLKPYLVDQEEQQQQQHEQLDLSTVLHSSDLHRDQFRELLTEVDRSFSFVQRYSARLTQYLNMYFRNLAEDIEGYREKEHKEIRQAIQRWKKQSIKLYAIIEEHECGMVMISMLSLKTRIKNCAQDCLEKIYRLLPQWLKQRTEELVQKMTGFKHRLTETPTEGDVKQFIQFYDNTNIIAGELDGLSTAVAEANFICSILEENRATIGQTSQSIKKKKTEVVVAQKHLTDLNNLLNDANMIYGQLSQKAQLEVKQLVDGVEADIENLNEKIMAFDINNDKTIQANLEFLEGCQNELDRMFQHSKVLHTYEKYLQMEESQDVNLQQFSKSFECLYKIWKSKSKYDTFMDEMLGRQFRTLEMPQIQQNFTEISEGIKEILMKQESLTYLTEKDVQTSQDLWKNLDSTKPLINCLRVLNDTNLKQRQWQRIKTELAANMQSPQLFSNIDEPSLTVRVLHQNNIEQHVDFLQSLSTRAKRQQQLSQILKKVSAFWQSSIIQYNLYKDYKDVYVLGKNEELYEKIQECQVQLTLFYESRYTEGLQAEADKQKKMFSLLEQLLSEWKCYQEQWLFLQPLLSNSFFKQSVKEMKSFTASDNNWRKVMKLCKDFTAKRWIEYEPALQALKTNNVVLESLRKMVVDLVQRKRENYPKLYLLSQSQIVQLISEFKDIRSLQNHLNLVFPAVSHYDFSQVDKDAQRSDVPTGLVNCDGQLLVLKTLRLGSEADECLKNLEQSMRVAVKSSLKTCLSAMDRQNHQRKKWITEHISQAIYLMEMLYWTKITESDYLSAESQGDLSDLVMLQLLQLQDLVQMLQQPVDKKLIYSLMVHNIGNRDTAEILKKENVKSVEDYRWQQQLRVYFSNEIFTIRQMSVEITYGYEFIGIFERNPINNYELFRKVSEGGLLSFTDKTALKDLANVTGRTLIEYDCRYATKSLMDVVQGCLMTGEWLNLSSLETLKDEVLREIAHYLNVVSLAFYEKQERVKRYDKYHVLNKQCIISWSIPEGQELPRQLTDNFKQISIVTPSEKVKLELCLQKCNLWTCCEDFSNDLTEVIKIANEYYGLRTAKISDICQIFIKSDKLHKKIEENTLISLLLQELKIWLADFYGTSTVNIFRVFQEVFGGRWGVPQKPVLKQIHHKHHEVRRTSLVSMTNLTANLENLLKSYNVLGIEEGEDVVSAIEDAYHHNILYLSEMMCSNIQESLGKNEGSVFKHGIIPRFLLQKGEKCIVVKVMKTNDFCRFLINMVNSSCLNLPDGQRHKIDHTKLIIVSEEQIEQSHIFDIVIGIHEIPEKKKPKNQIVSFVPILMQNQQIVLSQLHNQWYPALMSSLLKHMKQLPEHLYQYLYRTISSYFNGSTPSVTDRGLEKIYAWSLFNALYLCCQEKLPFQKFMKIFFESLKLEHLKSNLLEYVVSLEQPEGVFKPMPCSMSAIPKELIPHVHFIQSFIKSGLSLLLLGSTGSLKSQTVQILQSASNTLEAIKVLKLTMETKEQDFLAKIRSLLRIRKNDAKLEWIPNSHIPQQTLSIFIDDINLNESIFRFVRDLSNSRLNYLWSPEHKQLCPLSKKITIHGIVNGRHPCNLEKIGNMTPLHFSEDPIAILHNCYRQILQTTFNEKKDVLEQLIGQTTNLVKQYRLLTAHDLAKFYRSIFRMECTTKQGWATELVQTVTGAGYERESVSSDIQQTFGVDVLNQWTPNGHVIRLHESLQLNAKLLEQWQKNHNLPCYSLLSGSEELIRQLETTKMWVHLHGDSEKFKQSMSLIEALLFRYADSQSKNRANFVIDLKQSQFNELYRAKNSCIDRYFRVVQVRKPKLNTDILKQPNLIERCPKEGSKLQPLIDKFTEIHKSQSTLVSQHLKVFSICQSKFAQLTEALKQNQYEQRILQKSIEQKQEQENKYVEVMKAETLQIQNLRREQEQLKESVNEKSEELKSMKDEGKQTDQPQKALDKLQEKINGLRDQIESQTKILSGRETFTQDCKKKREGFQNQLKVINGKSKTILEMLEILGQQQSRWRQQQGEWSKYRDQKLKELCFIQAALKSSIQVDDLVARQCAVRLVSTKSDKIVYLQGYKHEALKFYNRLLDFSPQAKMYEEGMVVENEELVAFSSNVPKQYKKLYLFDDGVGQPIANDQQFLFECSMKLFHPDKYISWLATQTTILEASIAVKKKQWQMASILTKSEKLLTEEPENVNRIKKILVEIEERLELSKSARDAQLEYAVQTQKCLKQAFQAVKLLKKINSIYTYSRPLLWNMMKCQNGDQNVETFLRNVLATVRNEDLLASEALLRMKMQEISDTVIDKLFLKDKPTLMEFRKHLKELQRQPGFEHFELLEVEQAYQNGVDNLNPLENLVISTLLQRSLQPALKAYVSQYPQFGNNLTLWLDSPVTIFEVRSKYEKLYFYQEIKKYAQKSGLQLGIVDQYQPEVEQCSIMMVSNAENIRRVFNNKSKVAIFTHDISSLPIDIIQNSYRFCNKSDGIDVPEEIMKIYKQMTGQEQLSAVYAEYAAIQSKFIWYPVNCSMVLNMIKNNDNVGKLWPNISQGQESVLSERQSHLLKVFNKLLEEKQSQSIQLGQIMEKLPSCVKIPDVTAFSSENIEIVVINEVMMMNKLVDRIRKTVGALEDSLKNRLILKDQTLLTKLRRNECVFGRFKGTMLEFVQDLQQKSVFFRNLEGCKWKLRTYPLALFLRPTDILKRLIRIQKKKCGNPCFFYLKLLSGPAPEPCNLLPQGCIFLQNLKVISSGSRIDSTKMCLEWQTGQTETNLNTVQLLTSDTQPVAPTYGRLTLQGISQEIYVPQKNEKTDNQTYITV